MLFIGEASTPIPAAAPPTPATPAPAPNLATAISIINGGTTEAEVTDRSNAVFANINRSDLSQSEKRALLQEISRGINNSHVSNARQIFNNVARLGGGGGNLSPADQREASQLSNELDQLTNQVENQQEVARAAGEAASDVGQDESYSRQRQEAGRNLVDTARRALQDFENQIEQKRGQLDVLHNNCVRQYDLGNFLAQNFYRELCADIVQAGMEAWSDCQAGYGEAFLIMHRASLLLLKAGNGNGGGNVSLAFNPTRIFQVREPAQDKSHEQFAQARATESDYRAQAAEAARLEADPFYGNRLSEARTELADAQRAHDHDVEEERAARDDRDRESERLRADSARRTEVASRIRNIREGGNSSGNNSGNNRRSSSGGST